MAHKYAKIKIDDCGRVHVVTKSYTEELMCGDTPCHTQCVNFMRLSVSGGIDYYFCAREYDPEGKNFLTRIGGRVE